MYSDRQFYSVGENIWVAAVYSACPQLKTHPWSSVIYVELIHWNGEPVVQAKYQMFDSHISGQLKIPDHIPSGYYYLRAYTRWMRNYSVYDYAYVPVKIINPFRADAETGPAQVSMDSNFKLDTLHIKSDLPGLTCMISKTIYSTRAGVDLEIFPENPNNFSDGAYMLSVTKTDFTELTVPFTITNGLFNTSGSSMQSPLLRLL